MFAYEKLLQSESKQMFWNLVFFDSKQPKNNPPTKARGNPENSTLRSKGHVQPRLEN